MTLVERIRLAPSVGAEDEADWRQERDGLSLDERNRRLKALQVREAAILHRIATPTRVFAWALAVVHLCDGAACRLAGPRHNPEECILCAAKQLLAEQAPLNDAVNELLYPLPPGHEEQPGSPG